MMIVAYRAVKFGRLMDDNRNTSGERPKCAVALRTEDGGLVGTLDDGLVIKGTEYSL